MLQIVETNLATFDHIHTTTSLYALAKHGETLGGRLGQRDSAGAESFKALLRRQLLYLQAGQLDGRQLTNTIWAAANMPDQLKVPRPMLTEVMGGLARAANKLSHQDVANSLWALAALGGPTDDKLRTIRALAASRAMGEPEHFQPQGLSNCAWALAALACENAEAIAAPLYLVAASRTSELEPQHVSNLLWSFASLGFSEGPAFWSFVDMAVSCARRFKAQEVANVTWALATVAGGDARGTSAMPAFAEAARLRAPEFKAQELLNTVWAFAASIEHVTAPRSAAGAWPAVA